MIHSLKTFFSRYPTTWVYLLLLLLAMAHLPFLYADADEALSWSRAPWSDEGLYSCQVRNYIQHGHAGLEQSDALIKTPLLGAFLYGGFKLFGVSIASGRLTLLLLSLILLASLAHAGKYVNHFLILCTPLLFFQYYIFHYTHLALSEVLASVFILSGIVLLYRALTDRPSLHYQVLSATCFAAAYFLKIQYAYIVLLAPVFLILALSYFLITQRTLHRVYLKTLLFSLGLQLAWGLTYVWCWYLPNKILLDHVLADQTGNRYVEWNVLFDHLHRYYTEIFLAPELIFFTYLFFFSVVAGVLIFLSKQQSAAFRILFPLLAVWILLELHKLPMLYLPSRYLVSAYVAMGCVIALVARECIHLFSSGSLAIKLTLVPLFLPFVFLFFIHGQSYVEAYSRRAFTILHINRALQSLDLQNRPIVGPWAPSLNWKVKGYSFPVWYDYFNDKDLIHTYHPKVIVSELDEEDSGYAYKKHHLALDSLAERIDYYTLAKWKIKVVVLK